MTQELLYTSAPRGLKPGSRGFCTVLSTQGMGVPFVTALEGLSGYRPVYPPGDARAALNPVAYSHLKPQIGGKPWHVLSRVADYGLDYSQRTNKLAHHVLLDRSELPPVGPAGLLYTMGFMRTEWEGEPRLVAPKVINLAPPTPNRVCRAWRELTGDAGWAGVLAESFLSDPERLVILLFAPGQDLLPLLAEAEMLLPVARRWDVTFSTYFTTLPSGLTCHWRCLLKDSAEAHQSLRFVNALRLDLTGPLPPAEGGDLVQAARTGVAPRVQSRPALPAAEDILLEAAGLPPPLVVGGDVPGSVEPSTGARLPASRGSAAPPLPPQLQPAAPAKKSRRTLADVDAKLAKGRRRWWLRVVLVLVALLLVGGAGLAGYLLLPKLRSRVPVLSQRSNKPVQALRNPAPAEFTGTGNGDINTAETGRKVEPEGVAQKPASPTQAMPLGDATSATSMIIEAAVAQPTVDATITPAVQTATSGDAQTPTTSGTNNSAIPLSPRVVTRIGLPAKQGDHPVFEFDKADQNRQFTLLIPDWIPLKSESDSNAGGDNIHLTIRPKETSSRTEIALITTKLHSLDARRFVVIHRKNADPKRHQQLAWCALDLRDPTRGLHQTKCFGDELQSPTLSSQKVQCPLPLSLTKDLLGNLKIDSVSITADGQRFNFVGTVDEDLQSDGFNSFIKKGFDSFEEFKGKLPAISIDIESKDGKTMLLHFVRKDAYLKYLEASLKKRVQDAANLSLEGKKLSGVVEELKTFERFAKSNNAANLKLIDEEISAANQIKPPNMAFVNTLTEFKSKLNELHGLASEYARRQSAIDSCRIVAARIYYELKVPGEEAPCEIDVVNFDFEKPASKSDPTASATPPKGSQPTKTGP